MEPWIALGLCVCLWGFWPALQDLWREHKLPKAWDEHPRFNKK